ncbi:hypothetical protein PV325_003640 [Microctonus aethiopoides]|uniref:Uncharacterized protein n=1 Tax=Microctonus aethiopoides TaxID=144406 RepID=A0AA39FLX4_9HYME|nr:hypothetical protein PV325_003640 [Microctonus aethiopoides]KAK0098397.1 hypothetical protein PV326_008829 [Microctonus aethiopoides]KAK0172057.1 hypothetical protein PV328_005426 [Microctonus aethiopoides]
MKVRKNTAVNAARPGTIRAMRISPNLWIRGWSGPVGSVETRSEPPVTAMELREMSVTTAEETAELLAGHNEDDDESYFIEYAIQKEIINRNRCPPGRRLLSQVAFQPETNTTTNSNQQPTKDFPVINFIHTTGPHWPPSRKREEAQALENLRKRVEQSKLTKANQITDNGGSASTSSIQIDSKQLEQLDNRPKLLKKDK